MTTHLDQSSVVWDSSLGCFVSDAHVNLAAVLHDYNPNFSLVFIPPKDRDATDVKPWAILNSTPGRPKHILRYLSDEEMKDTTAVLSWVFEGDLSKHRADDVFARIEARERAEKLLELKQQEERLADAQEFAQYAFTSRSPHTFRHNGQTYRK